MEIQIPIRVLPKQRPRVGRGHVYTPIETQRFEAQVRHFLRPFESEKIAGRVRVEIKIFFKKAKGRVPDLDNQIKSVLDAMNKVLFNDDSQIDVLIAKRVFCDMDSLVLIVEELKGSSPET